MSVAKDARIERVAASMERYAKEGIAKSHAYGHVDPDAECPWEMGEIDWRDFGRVAVDAMAAAPTDNPVQQRTIEALNDELHTLEAAGAVAVVLVDDLRALLREAYLTCRDGYDCIGNRETLDVGDPHGLAERIEAAAWPKA